MHHREEESSDNISNTPFKQSGSAKDQTEGTQKEKEHSKNNQAHDSSLEGVTAQVIASDSKEIKGNNEIELVNKNEAQNSQLNSQSFSDLKKEKNISTGKKETKKEKNEKKLKEKKDLKEKVVDKKESKSRSRVKKETDNKSISQRGSSRRGQKVDPEEFKKYDTMLNKKTKRKTK